MAHVKVDGTVVRCIDPRLKDAGRGFADQTVGKDCDDIAIAGGGLDTTTTLAQVGISVEKHGTPVVHLVSHEDCAYAQANGFDDGDLLVTAQALSEKFPGVRVETHYMGLDGSVRSRK
jgi:hypothetical protein